MKPTPGITFLVLLVFVNLTSAQESSVSIMEDIAADYCLKSESSNWEGKSLKEIANINAGVAMAVRSNKQIEIERLYQAIATENSGIGQKELVSEFVTLWTVSLFDNCPEYIKMVLELMPVAPKSNADLVSLAKNMDAYIQTLEDQSYDVQYHMAKAKLYDLLLESSTTAVSAEMLTAAQHFVRHHSKSFLKAYMVTSNLELLTAQ